MPSTFERLTLTDSDPEGLTNTDQQWLIAPVNPRRTDVIVHIFNVKFGVYLMRKTAQVESDRNQDLWASRPTGFDDERAHWQAVTVHVGAQTFLR